jgi:hypothetical protein
MVYPAFNIVQNDLAHTPDDCQLLIEISGQAFNFILFTRSPQHLYLLRQYRIYTSADKTNRDVLEEIISGDEILQKYSARATVVYNFPEANIIPAEIYKAELNVPFTRLIHGNTDHHFVFDEQVRDMNMHNVYFISRDVHSLCRDKFKGSEYWHLYTMILRWPTDDEHLAGSLARVVFYNDKFVAAIYKSGKLQLVQTFAYQTPEDAAYYLLLICKQLKITQSEIVLKLSGLIDAQSALYTELLKYFEKVEHEGIPSSFSTGGILDEYPSHYFSPLLKMSLCV